MRVAGIDYSTKSIDVVTVPWDARDASEAFWRSIELKPVSGDPLAVAGQVRDRLLGAYATMWSDVDAVYLEDPYSKGRQTVKALARVQGAIRACLPRRTQHGELAVQVLPPSAWHQTFCGRGGLGKEGVLAQALRLGAREGLSGDFYDALGIALVGAWHRRATRDAEAVA